MTEPRPPSGLRNPAAAVRGVGAGTLAAEGLVLLLAIVPIRVLGGDGVGTVVIAAFTLASFVLAALLGRRWAWVAATVLQAVLFASGFVVHGALAVLGILFGSVWLYVLHVRRTVLGRPRR